MGFCIVALLLLHLWTVEGSNPTPYSPHGLSHRNPFQTSPNAVKFFGPSPSPLEERQHYQNTSSPTSGDRTPGPAESGESSQDLSVHSGDISEATVAGIVFVVLFGVAVAVGGSYIYVTRRSNIKRANSLRSPV